MSDVKNSRLRLYLPVSVKDRVILANLQGFSLQATYYMRSFVKIKPSRKFPNPVRVSRGQ